MDITSSKPLRALLPLGAPPSHWEVARLRDVASKIGSGATPRGGEKVYRSSGVSLIRSQNVHDHEFRAEGLAYIDERAASQLNGVAVREGDVLLNITGDSIARCCVAPPWVLPAGVNQHVAIIRPTEQLDSIFLQKYLSHPRVKTYMLGHDAGGTRKALTKGHVEGFLVPLPPLEEQRAIASVLGALDAKIELNRRMNETLESIAQTLFRSWFVDFDPVRAKAEGREPYGIDSKTASLFPSAFQASKLGDIPLGWQVAPLTARVEILGGGTPSTSVAEFWGGGVPWVSVVDTVPGPYIIRTAKTVSETAVARGAAKMLPVETVVLTARGTVGNSALMAVPMSMNQSCYGLRGKDGAGQLFVLQRIREQVTQLKASSHGSVFDTITTQTLHGLLVVWPGMHCMEAFENRVRPLFDQILENARQALTLEAIRDALLPKLLSGELRVTSAEQLVGTTA